jgi:hypothetical protein
MKRRNFLKFGAGTAAAAAIPTTLTAQEQPTQEQPTQTKPHPSMPITPSMQRNIDRCARYQEKAMNGDPFLTIEEYAITCDKEASSRLWQGLADICTKIIENDAHALGYHTIWPGIYPHFTQLPK